LSYIAAVPTTGQPLSFSLHDEIEGLPLTPENVDLLKEIDEDKLKLLWRKGRKAWAEITNPTDWVERLRES
jgi:hypothetical protein